MTATQNRLAQALIHGVGVSITRFMDATGLYAGMLRTFTGSQPPRH